MTPCYDSQLPRSFRSLLTALPTAQAPARPQRIISLIPAVTEILFAIGAGPQVVAVSSFDEYPPEVKNLQRVGALLDPDLERILSLRPDLVVVYGSQLDLMKQLERAGIPAYNYRHAALPDVSRTIREVGDRIGHAAEAEALIKKIDAQMTSIRQRVSGRSRPRTMLVVGREIGALRGIYASGGYGFLHDMLEAAGGDDVFAARGFPSGLVQESVAPARVDAPQGADLPSYHQASSAGLDRPETRWR